MSFDRKFETSIRKALAKAKTEEDVRKIRARMNRESAKRPSRLSEAFYRDGWPQLWELANSTMDHIEQGIIDEGYALAASMEASERRKFTAMSEWDRDLERTRARHRALSLEEQIRLAERRLRGKS